MPQIDASPPPDQDAVPAGGAVPPSLVLISTPLGNLGDLSPRARDALATVDLVLCEDTRVTGALLAANGLSARMLPLHDHNEASRGPALLDRMRAGTRMALVSDAGTPLVSDPGFRLARAAIEAGLAVSAIPGPNAAVMALTLSGLPPLPFLVLGFPPARQAERRAAFGGLRAAELAGLAATLVWYESPHRVAETLDDLATVFGDRPAALARELTKRFEEVRRGSLTTLRAGCAATPPRGEITLVVGPPAAAPADVEGLDDRLRAALATHSVKDAAALVAAATGLPRRTVYSRALELARE